MVLRVGIGAGNTFARKGRLRFRGRLFLFFPACNLRDRVFEFADVIRIRLQCFIAAAAFIKFVVHAFDVFQHIGVGVLAVMSEDGNVMVGQ